MSSTLTRTRHVDAPTHANDTSAPRCQRPRWVRLGQLGFFRWRRFITAHPTTALIYRWLVGIVGAYVIVVGLILVPLPGPGWLIVLFGVAIIASEFAWAARLLLWGRHKLHQWAQWIARSHWTVGAGIGTATFLCVTGAVWCTFKLLGLPDWVPQDIQNLVFLG